MEINECYKYLDKINDFKRHEKKKNRLKNTSKEELKKSIRQNKMTINLPKEINT